MERTRPLSRVEVFHGSEQSPILRGMIYHLAKQEAWREAQRDGVYRGLAGDRADGFLHFSTATQIVESAEKHRAGEVDLVLLAVDETMLGAALVWEPSRKGALFPHLYGDLPMDAVKEATPLALDDRGRHLFPDLVIE
jgi:uncharacterized protein (DUF952 family)